MPAAALLCLLIALAAPAAAAAQAPARPFGSHPAGLGPGTSAPRFPAAERDGVAAAAYDAWARRYLEPACAPGEWRVAAGPDAPAHTVSEGQGYGMVVVALMAGHDPAARERFDGLARYALGHPSRVDGRLVAWAQDARCRDVEGGDSATDGDLDAAYGLLLAHAQWGSGGALDYLGAARRMLAGILAEDVHPGTDLTLLGDWTARGAPRHWHASRPSDWMLGHFAAFAAATGDARWTAVRAAHLRVIRRLQGRTGLLPDFVRTRGRVRPAGPGFLEGRDDGRYSWNACRTPWRIGTDAAAGGDPRSRAAAARMSRWARRRTGGRPARIRAGYTLGGRPLVSYGSMAFTAPFLVAAMSERGAAARHWRDRLWRAVAAAPAEGYYPDSIRLQSLLVASGNWWTPSPQA